MFRVSVAFQSPKSGKFESNTDETNCSSLSVNNKRFNPLNRGNLNQILRRQNGWRRTVLSFQSPKSGKFESNFHLEYKNAKDYASFNPLNRGNLNQM